MSVNAASDYAAAFAGKHVLVVEDEFLIALDIQRVLEGAGVKVVVTASRVAQALDLIMSHDAFDAAVLDLRVERESATPIAERLEAASVPFVFVTGAPSDAEMAMRFSSVPVVGKPFESSMLLAALALVMQRSRPRA